MRVIRKFAIISYAIREADGIDCLIEFLESLKVYKVSPRSKVIVAIKEASAEFYSEAQKIILSVKADIGNIQLIQVPQGGFDIGSHVYIARTNSCDVIIFMTATSRANVKGWDQILLKPFNQKSVGVVGSMQSSESLRTGYLDMIRTRLKIWFRIELSQDDRFVACARGILPHRDGPVLRNSWLTQRIVSACTYALINIYKNVEPLNFVLDFPPFPNPHLRTTGFAIRRELLLSVVDQIPSKKPDAFNYESGHANLVERSRQLGWTAVVVSKSGKVHGVGDKSARRTFRWRGGDSVVTDRESRRFKLASKEVQGALQEITHGR